MSVFHHHPDGKIFIYGEAGEYIDTVANFLLDYDQPYEGPGEGMKVRYYTPGGTHIVSDGNNERFMEASWPEGDAIIQALPQLLAAKQLRLNPPKTLAETAEAKKEAIKAERNRREAASPFVYGGSNFDYDSLSRERIDAAVSGAIIDALGGAATSTVVNTWTLYDNTTRDMTIADWLAFRQAELTRREALHGTARTLKAAVDAALAAGATAEEIAALPVWEE